MGVGEFGLWCIVSMGFILELDCLIVKNGICGCLIGT